MNGKTMDLFKFCLDADQASGSYAIQDLSRLSAELVATDGELVWNFSGGRHQIGAPELKLHIQAQVKHRRVNNLPSTSKIVLFRTIKFYRTWGSF